MTCSSYTTLKCDSMFEGERCDLRFVHNGDAGQTRARAKKEGWLTAVVIPNPLKPFGAVKRQDFCPLHRYQAEQL